MPKLKPDGASAMILHFLQNYPDSGKNTSVTELIEQMQKKGIDFSEGTLRSAFSRIARQGLVMVQGPERGSGKRNYLINYMHRDIPDVILDGAPTSVQMGIKRRLQGMKKDQYLDNDGCIVTPNAVEKTVEEDADPFDEAGAEAGVNAVNVPYVREVKPTFIPSNDEAEPEAEIEEYEPVIQEEEHEELKEEKEEGPRAEVPESKTQEVSVPVKVERDGKTMNISVNITLNL